MRTCSEWYTRLPEGYRELALANLEAQGRDQVTDTLHQAINRGFTWTRTPEGEHFWRRILEEVRFAGCYADQYNNLPPIPNRNWASDLKDKLSIKPKKFEKMFFTSKDLPKEYRDLLPYDSNYRLDGNERIGEFFPYSYFWESCGNATSVKDLPKIPEKDENPQNKPLVTMGANSNYEIKWFENGRRTLIRFKKQSINNCGLAMVQQFTFLGTVTNNSPRLFAEGMRSVFSHYYPFVMATHNEDYFDWFEYWETIDEFTNPNSHNEIRIYKLEV